MKKSKKKAGKRAKLNLQRVVSGSLSSVILFQSCADPIYFLNEPDIVTINKKLLSSPNAGFSAININMDIETKQYLLILNNLLSDIINDTNSARLFSENPEKYISKNYGIKGIRIDMDEYLLKTVLAFSNVELCKAIRNNDIHKFLDLSLSLDILNKPNESDLDFVKKIIADNPELLNNDSLSSSLVAFALAAVVAIVVFTWAAAVTYFNVTVFHNLAVGHNQTVSTKTNTKGSLEIEMLLNSNLCQIWSLKGGDIDKLYIMNDIYEDMLISDILKFIEKKYPEQFKSINMEKIKQAIKLNVEKMK